MLNRINLIQDIYIYNEKEDDNDLSRLSKYNGIHVTPNRYMVIYLQYFQNRCFHATSI